MSQPSSMTYNNTWLGSDTYGVLVTRGPYPVLPPVRIQPFTYGQREGGIQYGGQANELTLQVDATIEGDNLTDLRTRIDNINNIMNPLDGDKNIQFDYMPGRYWSGRLLEPIAAPLLGITAIDVQFTFRCADPFAYSTTETAQNESITTDPDTFSVPSSGTLGGSRQVRPVIDVTNNTGGTRS